MYTAARISPSKADATPDVYFVSKDQRALPACTAKTSECRSPTFHFRIRSPHRRSRSQNNSAFTTPKIGSRLTATLIRACRTCLCSCRTIWRGRASARDAGVRVREHALARRAARVASILARFRCAHAARDQRAAALVRVTGERDPRHGRGLTASASGRGGGGSRSRQPARGR